MKTQAHTFDIIALGQSFVDLFGEQQGASLKDMMSFKKHVGGMSAFACGFARLGLKTALISSVGQDDFGQFILESMAHENVDVSQVQVDARKQTALMLRAMLNRFSFPTLTHKNNCADVLEEEADLCSSFIGKSQALFITSSNFNSKNAQRIIKEAISVANQKQTKVILALDYVDDNNQNILLKTLPFCSLVIGNESDFAYLSGEKDPFHSLSSLRALTNAIFVMKNSQGCFVFSQIPHDLTTAPHHAGFLTDKLIPFTSKESFITGFIFGWLNGFSSEKSCEYAMASLALTQSREEHSDSFPNMDALKIFLSSQSQVVQTIRTPLFDHLHYAQTRAKPHEHLFTFSFGHPQVWSKLAESANVDENTLTKAKMLIASGIQQAAMKNPHISLMTQADPQEEIIDSLPSPHVLMRSLDAPGVIPLQIQGDADITHTLLTWPKHHAAKVTLAYHPDDRYALRQQQEATLNHLYLATRRTGHELIVEISPPTNSLITASTISHIMQRIYEIGIYPDWWQISPPRDLRAFENISRVISENDRFCHGVLMMAQHATFEQLPIIFNACAKQPYSKGFIVDKSLFHVALNQWLAQSLSNQVFVETVCRNFEKAISIWEQTKSLAIEKEEAAKAI